MSKLYRHDNARLDNEIDNIYLSIKDLPIGTVLVFVTPDNGDNPNTWPEGWLSLKSSIGRVYPVADYPELATLLGNDFIVSDGRFIVPGIGTPLINPRGQYYIKAK